MKILTTLRDEERKMYEELEKETQNVIRVHFPIERSLRNEHGKKIQDMFVELEEICTAGVNAKRKSLNIFGRATGQDLVEAVCQRLDSNEACQICHQVIPNNVVMVSCCDRLCCGACIMKYRQNRRDEHRVEECPLCRRPHLTHTIHNIPTCILPKPYILATLPSKLASVLEHISKDPCKKSMIFSLNHDLSSLCPIFREALEAYDFKVFELEKPVSRNSRKAVIRDFNASSSNAVLIANLFGLGSYPQRASVAQTAARVVYLLQGYRSPAESTIIGCRFGDATLKTFLAKDTIEERRLMHIDNQSYFELVIPSRNEYAFLTKLAKIKI